MGDAGGDTTVTITGTGLSNAKVYFGVKPGKIVRDNGTTIIAITPIAPPGAGTVQVTIATAGGTAATSFVDTSKSPLTTAVNGLQKERETGLEPATSSLGS